MREDHSLRHFVECGRASASVRSPVGIGEAASDMTDSRRLPDFAFGRIAAAEISMQANEVELASPNRVNRQLHRDNTPVATGEVALLLGDANLIVSRGKGLRIKGRGSADPPLLFPEDQIRRSGSCRIEIQVDHALY
jgi:hypothetical protein